MENIRHFSRTTLCLSLNFHTSQETTCYSKCSWPEFNHTKEESILNANSRYTDTVLWDAWCLTVGISCTYAALAAAPLIFKLCMQCECGDVALQLYSNLALIQLHLETLFKSICSHIRCALGFIGSRRFQKTVHMEMQICFIKQHTEGQMLQPHATAGHLATLIYSHTSEWALTSTLRVWVIFFTGNFHSLKRTDGQWWWLAPLRVVTTVYIYISIQWACLWQAWVG